MWRRAPEHPSRPEPAFQMRPMPVLPSRPIPLASRLRLALLLALGASSLLPAATLAQNNENSRRSGDYIVAVVNRELVTNSEV